MNIVKYLRRLRDFENRWWVTGYKRGFLLLDFEVSPVEYYFRGTHAEAIMYCFTLDIDGKTDWRLPTTSEITAGGLHNGFMLMHCSDIPYDVDALYGIRPVRSREKMTTFQKILNLVVK